MSSRCTVSVKLSATMAVAVQKTALKLYGFRSVNAGATPVSIHVWLKEAKCMCENLISWNNLEYALFRLGKGMPVGMPSVVNPRSVARLDEAGNICIYEQYKDGMGQAFRIKNLSGPVFEIGIASKHENQWHLISSLTLRAGEAISYFPSDKLVLMFSQEDIACGSSVDTAPSNAIEIDMRNGLFQAVSFDVELGWKPLAETGSPLVASGTKLANLFNDN